MLTYGSMLGKQAASALEPLHVPGRDPRPDLDLLGEGGGAADRLGIEPAGDLGLAEPAV
jgi:hypothetical protein